MKIDLSPRVNAAIAEVRRREYPDFFRVAKNLFAGKCDLTPDYESFGHNKIESSSLDDAQVITSQVAGTDTHKIAIDLDMDAALIPSSTPGHFHLIIDHEIEWKQYLKLLKALHDAGVIQDGYYNASATRGATVLRTPWTKKAGDA